MIEETKLQRFVWSAFGRPRFTIWDCGAIAAATFLLLTGHWFAAALWCLIGASAPAAARYLAAK